MGKNYILICILVIIFILFGMLYFEYRRIKKNINTINNDMSVLCKKVDMMNYGILSSNIMKNKPKEVSVLSASYQADKNIKNNDQRIKTEDLFDNNSHNASDSIDSKSSNTVKLNIESTIKSVDYQELLNNIDNDIKKLDTISNKKSDTISSTLNKKQKI